MIPDRSKLTWLYLSFGLLFILWPALVFSQNTNRLLFEKVYLHTDRDAYLPGDTIWFKGYLVNAQNNKLINSSGVLYVDLISPDAKVIATRLAKIKDGLCSGDIEMADTIKHGKYRLRAYTNWMRNFGDNLVFDKQLIILPTGDEPATTKKAVAGYVQPRNTIDRASIGYAPVIHFFPEGGSLVEGISSRVAIKVEDYYSRLNYNYTGAIISSRGDTVSHFNCDSAGTGLFTLMPIHGQSYKAVFNGINGNVYALPAALYSGLTLQIRQKDSVVYAAIVSTQKANANQPLPFCTLAIKHAGKTLIRQQLQLREGQGVLKIPYAALPEGVSSITLYDELNKPNCERLIYIYAKNRAGILLAADKQRSNATGKVAIQINAPPSTTLSMAVVDAETVPEQPENIESYLLLKSEIRGRIAHPARYFDTTNVKRFEQLDLLLMTQGWRDFVWHRLADTAISITYKPENGISIAGTVTNEINKRNLPGLNVTLYGPGLKGNKLFSAITDSAGRFNYPNLMLYGRQHVTLTAANNKGEKQGAFSLDTIAQMTVQPEVDSVTPQRQLPDTLSTAMEKKLAAAKLRFSTVRKLKEVKISDRKTVITKASNVLMPFGPAEEFVIKPEDEKYKTLEWYVLQNSKTAHQSSKEYNGIIPTGVEFPGLDTMKTSPPTLSSAPLILYKSVFTLIPPILFVNGRELSMDENTEAEAYRNLYFNLPINKFKSIKIQHMVGTLHGVGADGKLLVAGSENVLIDRFFLYLTLPEDALTFNPGRLGLDVNGYSEEKVFYQPTTEKEAAALTYRNTLHWEPFIKTDAAGKALINFYNNPSIRLMRVMVQGITADGKPVSAVYDFKITH